MGFMLMLLLICNKGFSLDSNDGPLTVISWIICDFSEYQESLGLAGLSLELLANLSWEAELAGMPHQRRMELMMEATFGTSFGLDLS